MNQQRTEAIVFRLTKGPPSLNGPFSVAHQHFQFLAAFFFAAAIVIGNQSSSH